MPESLLRHKFHNLIRVYNMPRGGHFAAFEEPDVFAEELWEHVDLIEKSLTDKMTRQN